MKRILKIVLLLTCIMALSVTTFAEKKKKVTTPPKVVELKQIAPNTIRITFDHPVKIDQATNIKNYWVKNLGANTPDDISFLGNQDSYSDSNTVNQDKAKIIPKDNLNEAVFIRFKKPIPAGGKYEVKVVNVGDEKHATYTGTNGVMQFTGK